MKAYSQDLRQRVLRAIDAGQSQALVAKTFAVSVPTIKRYLKQRRESGHVLSKAIPGRPAKKGAILQAHLRVQFPRDAQRVVTNQVKKILHEEAGYREPFQTEEHESWSGTALKTDPIRDRVLLAGVSPT